MDSNIEIVCEFLNVYKDNNKILNINTIKYDDLTMIYTNILSNNLHHSNKKIDNFIHNINFCVIDNDYNIKALMYKNLNISLLDMKVISDNNFFNKLTFYKYYIGHYYILFEHNNKKYYATRYEINLLDNNKTLIYLQTSNNISNNFIHINSKYHNILCYSDNNKLLSNDIINLQEDTEIKFTSFDDFKLNIENLNKNNILNKKITYGGYIIKFNNISYKINTLIYNELKSNIPSNININKCFLKLYQNNKLYLYINYISLYPNDILQRINLSIKNIAKELLNLYHITRNKNNSALYNRISNNYKKVLYELHTKFIEIRKTEFNLDDQLEIKKSITLNIVYNYLKELDIEYLIMIYIERFELIKILNDLNLKNIMSECINTTTISYLLNKN
jgi:hypothetical protein